MTPGIVHRDLKPENIMVTRSGRVKIVDFGLARPGEARESDGHPPETDAVTLTEIGLRAGTVPYMSPEQTRGVRSDFRVDQFAFGLIVRDADRPASVPAVHTSRDDARHRAR